MLPGYHHGNLGESFCGYSVVQTLVYQGGSFKDPVQGNLWLLARATLGDCSPGR